MENKALNTLKEMIKENSKSKMSGILSMDNGLEYIVNSSLEFDKKRNLLEQLYLFQLYSDAYLYADPRTKMDIITKLNSLLKFENESNFDELSDFLTDAVEKFKNAETNPYETACRKTEDMEKYGNVIF